MRLAVADVETTFMVHGERPRTLFWGLAIEGDDIPYREFETTAKFWNFVMRYHEPLCIYSHHDYDMVQAMVDGAPVHIKDVRSGRVLRAKIGECHEWRNSHALFPSSLKEILESCGFAKPSLDDLAARNRADTVDALAAFKRCSEQYEALWGVAPLGSKFLTASSCAFAAAQRVAGPLPVSLCDRDAYRGGRVEAFRVGDCGDADAWDINSSYPAAFADCPDNDVLVYMDVDVKTDGPGPFCWINENAEKLMFPQGRFRTAVWASNYERYIRPHGGIKACKTIRAIKVDLGWLKALRGTVSEAYEMRKAAKKRGDGAYAYAAKIGLNSIYGRLGLKDEREIAIVGTDVPEGDDITYYPVKGGYLSFKTIRTRPSANYHYAGWITDNARARLYDGLMRAEGEPLYCDTDSVYIRAGSKFPVKQGGALGAWKSEGTDRLWVFSVKDYVFGEKTVRKGGDKNFQWTLKRCASGKNVAEIVKHRTSQYDKRAVFPDGSTVPVYMGEW